MFPLFETIKIVDGHPMNLDFHQQRVDRSYAQYYKSKRSPKLNHVLKVTEEFSKGTVKCRFLYNRSSYEIAFSFYQARKIHSLRIVNGDHIQYSMKFTDRNSIEELLKLKGSCDDILILKDDLISDTSYTNIVFFDGERWVTPQTPLLNGTCRMRLLSEGRIVESRISHGDLYKYSSFKLINAMLDFDEQKELMIESIFL